MTEPGHDGVPPPSQPEPAGMPRWVPVLIGVVLVTFAALAVFTGLRYRDDTLTRQIRPRQDRGMAPAPPGEPGAGASLVLHGEAGENTPRADEPVQGRSRTVVSGGRDGIEAVTRLWARRGMVLNVEPADALVYVNGLPIGQVRQFDTMNEVYDFAEPGSYTVRIVAPDGKQKSFVVTATDEADAEVARIEGQIQ